LNNNGTGIELIHQSNYKIIGNTITNNSYYGIRLKDSSNSSISQNVIKNSRYGGINIRESFAIIIQNNTVSESYSDENNGQGIGLGYAYDNLISNNHIKDNVDGILLINASFNRITNNIISNSSSEGVDFKRISTYNTFKGNYFVNNTYGMYVLNTINDNIFYHNNFINNTKNAIDEGNNTWDNDYPSGGNYWDDYTGNDIDGDGIGDTPYTIPGGDNEDRYPLMEPYGNGSENETFFGTLGPICPLLNIAEIKLIDGNESQIQKIEKILNNRRFG